MGVGFLLVFVHVRHRDKREYHGHGKQPDDDRRTSVHGLQHHGEWPAHVGRVGISFKQPGTFTRARSYRQRRPGHFVTFDAPSYASFLAAGGTFASGTIVTVRGREHEGAAAGATRYSPQATSCCTVSLTGAGVLHGLHGGRQPVHAWRSQRTRQPRSRTRGVQSTETRCASHAPTRPGNTGRSSTRRRERTITIAPGGQRDDLLQRHRVGAPVSGDNEDKTVTSSKPFGYVVLVLVVCALVLGIYSGTRMTALSQPSAFGAAGPAAPGPGCLLPHNRAQRRGRALVSELAGQAAWFIDRQNTSGCASDGNLTCSQSTCTAGPPGIADGPCASFSQIITRYGTYRPRLRQSTTYTWMSGESLNNDSDPVYIQPFLENKASVFATGTPTVVATTTLGTITAKSITTSPSLLLAVINTDAASLSAGMFMVNTTHAGEGWLYANTSGSTWSLTQPLPLAQTTAIGTGIPFGAVGAEQNSYTSGDSVTIETFPEVVIGSIDPVVESWNSSFGGGVYISNVQIQQQGTGNRSPVFIRCVGASRRCQRAARSCEHCKQHVDVRKATVPTSDTARSFTTATSTRSVVFGRWAFPSPRTSNNSFSFFLPAAPSRAAARFVWGTWTCNRTSSSDRPRTGRLRQRRPHDKRVH